MDFEQPIFLDFRRLWNPIWMVLTVIAALLAIDTTLRALIGPAPAALKYELRVNAQKRARMLETIFSAQHRITYKKAAAVHASRTCMIVGSSSAKFGLDETMMESSSERAFTVLNMSGNGLGFQELNYQIKAMHRAGLRAEVLVVAIHPVFLIEARAGVPNPFSPSERDLAHFPNFTHHRWAIANLSGMHAAIENQMMELRFKINHRFGLPASALDLPAENNEPGSDYFPSDLHASAPLSNRIMRHWKQMGAFDPHQYTDLDQEIAELQALVRRTRTVAARTIILLMPEMSEFRESVPPIAEAVLTHAVISADSDCSMLDLRDALSDEDCFDWMHVNSVGRAKLSREVALRLLDLMGGSPDQEVGGPGGRSERSEQAVPPGYISGAKPY